ncbi:MAG: 23S rRNA (adenine(2503)-C(2))-methyltransferase RlmN [Kiritimatiellia bacterium]|nr:23S rRNA (adenine(2503)-C(2))-methyltransferase RlmN [Kiritimatiellia bacterium]
MSRALFGMTLDELAAETAALGLPAFAARQMTDWLYAKNAASIEEMTNLPKAARTALAETFEIGRTPPAGRMQSADGVRKYLFPVDAGRAVETAWIPDRDRATLCVSTQIGCCRACRFCATGRMGLRGNLSGGQILNQLASLPDPETVTNLVFMGIGEPLDNPEATLAAVRILTAPWGYAWSPSRISVSTVGILPALERLLAESRCHVAWSLHSPFPDERATLMPVERQYPMLTVLEVLRQSAAFEGQRRLMIEITLLRGINDSLQHARETERLLRGLRCRVNLIPFNPTPDLPFEASGRDTLEAYQDVLIRAGRRTTIRNSRGADIFAACGLLATARPERGEGDVPKSGEAPKS